MLTCTDKRLSLSSYIHCCSWLLNHAIFCPPRRKIALLSCARTLDFRRSCSSQSPPPGNRSIARICGCTHRRGQAHCSGIRSNFKRLIRCAYSGADGVCSSRVDVPDSSANWLSPGAESLQASSGAYLFGDPCSRAALVQPPP